MIVGPHNLCWSDMLVSYSSINNRLQDLHCPDRRVENTCENGSTGMYKTLTEREGKKVEGARCSKW